MDSFGYFSQPYYWRADYGYRGDWNPEKIILRASKERHKAETPQQIMHQVMHLRNIVFEMSVELRSVKPIRPPNKELQKPPAINIELV